MAEPLIKTVFASDIGRRIEEVIKVDQTDEEILRAEFDEYVVTDAIRKHFTKILEAYRETPNKRHEGIGIWVSGFFGSGKSSFAKILGLIVSNRRVHGDSLATRFAERAHDKKVAVLLNAIEEHIPTHAVIFDVSTDRGIKSGNQTLTEITYRLFLQSLGYAKDLDLSELEIELEAQGRLDAFKAEYRKLFEKEWDAEKGKLAFSLSEASHVMHSLKPLTFTQADSWVKAVKDRNDVTPGKLADRCAELMKRRAPGQSLMFVVDEVGQFVARDVQKMLDLQAVVQSLGRVGGGKHWLVVTSQEKLSELVGGLDDARVELARLMDRFPSDLQVHLENSDISEVTSRRVLSKNAAAEERLGKLFDEHRGRLTDNTHLTADIKLPDLNRQGFIDLYPLLPYQVDLIINVVSGLRTQGGAARHVGGANRTIIKLAQQLLINPAVKLAEQPIGVLARIDQIYDLVEGNIGSEVRAKIASIPQEVEHPLAQAVAKAICLLQYVKTIHRTPENIAAALHPGVAADSQLAAVKDALQKLEAAHKVRLGGDGYRIPTPAEDDWERTRMSLAPRPGDAHRLHAEVLTGFWQPAPQHTLLDTKTFKAGLVLHGREIVPGDILVHAHLAEAGTEFESTAQELRRRSQEERKSIFWAVALNDAIDRETVELHRSKEIVVRKEREARGDDIGPLIAEERARLRRHEGELRRLLKAACLSGSVYFRGNDRSPADPSMDVGRAAGQVLGEALPEVFERFEEAAARVQKKDLDSLLTSENLHGLTPVFSALGLLRDEQGRPVFRTESGPLAEVFNRIQERANYGETANGRYLTDEFAKEPFGWDFDVVRLLTLSLLRAGKIEATSKAQTFDSATGAEAKETFGNNNLFRQASFRPKKGIEFPELVKASQAFKDTFGTEVKELAAGPIVAELRREVARHEDSPVAALNVLTAHRLPGGAVLEGALAQMKAILRGSEDAAIGTFNAGHRSIKEGIKRAAELEQTLGEPQLRDLARARDALAKAWPFLECEADVEESLREKAGNLADLLKRETFFRELAAIDQHAAAIEKEYAQRYAVATQQRVEAYQSALERLVATAGWVDLDEDQRARISAPLRRGADAHQEGLPIALIRSDRDACEPRLKAAIAEVRRLREGERVATLSLTSYFSGGIETEEQLDAALAGIREECARLIGAGKKVVVE